jgi:hypothetical protein
MRHRNARAVAPHVPTPQGKAVLSTFEIILDGRRLLAARR